MTAGGFPHSEILGSKPGWRLPEAYRSLQRPSSVLSAKASTPRPCRQPIHPYGTRKTPYRQIPRRQIITSEMITKRSTNNNKQKHSNEVRSKNNRSKTKAKGLRLARVHYPVLKPPRATRPRTPQGDARTTHGQRTAPREKPAGWRSGSPKACPYHASRMISSTPAPATRHDHRAGAAHTVRKHGLQSP